MSLLPESPVAREARLAGDEAAPRARRATPQNHRLDGELEVRLVNGASWQNVPEADWADLAAEAADPNIFHERWFLGPALSQFGSGRDIVLVLVYRRSRRRDLSPALVGLFPIERIRNRWGTTALQLFSHDYCFLNTPLLRQGHEPLVWSAFLDWAETESGAHLVHLPTVRGEGVVAQALTSALSDRNQLSLITTSHVRALLQRSSSAEEYVEQSQPAKTRHEAERQYRRLQELGPVEFRSLANHGAEHWLRDFLELEASGWKGAAHTALALSEQARKFITEVFHAAHREGKLQVIGLWVNQQPIALKLNFLAFPGSFAFKIAYSENFARYSPGVQLEQENIRRLHDEPGVEWMDSCAAPKHPMINRLWRERTIIQDVLISCGGVRGHLAIGLRPLARALRRLCRRRRTSRTTDAKATESRNAE